MRDGKRIILLTAYLCACATSGAGIRGYSLRPDAPEVPDVEWRRGAASVVIRRESPDQRGDSLIRLAESLQASRSLLGGGDHESVSDPGFPGYWGHSSGVGGSLILPYSVDATTLDYLLAHAAQIAERWPDAPPPSGSAAPSTPAAIRLRLEYVAKAERSLDPDVPGSAFLVTLRLVYTGSVGFIKHRRVWFDADGAVLAVSGDGKTVPIIQM